MDGNQPNIIVLQQSASAENQITDASEPVAAIENIAPNNLNAPQQFKKIGIAE